MTHFRDRRCGYWVIAILFLGLTAHAQTTKPAPANITGRVYSSDDKPIAGARVTAYDQANDADGYPRLGIGATDAKGQFAIPLPNVAAVIVAVQAKGYGLCLLEAPVNRGDDPLTIEMIEPAAPIKIRIIGSNGASPAGVRIGPGSFMRNVANGTFGYWPRELAQDVAQTTDAAGICTFEEMPRHTSILFGLDDDRFQSVRPDAAPTAANPGPGRADLTLEPPREPAPITIEPASVIEGRVIFADTGQPAPNVEIAGIQRISASGTRIGRAKSDANGKFRMGAMEPVEARLIARVPYPLSSQYAGQVLMVQPAPGRTRGGIELLLTKGATIRGEVTNTATAQPAGGITITARAVTSGGAAGAQERYIAEDTGRNAVYPTAISAADGTYELHLPAGRYTLRAKAPDQFNLVADGNDNQQVDAAEGNETAVSFAFRPSRTASVGLVKGTVVDEQDKPIEGAEVEFYISAAMPEGFFIGSGNIPRNSNMQRVISDAAGKFEMYVGGPSAQLYAHKGELGLVPTPPPGAEGGRGIRRLLGESGVPSSVTVSADKREPRLVLKRAAGSVVVHVIHEDGQPFAGATVAIGGDYPWATLAPRWGTTRADGTFTFAPVYPDRTYAMKIFAPGHAPLGANVLMPAPILPIDPGKQTETPPYELSKTDSFISGIVVDEQGAPMINALVTVSGSTAQVLNQRTDDQGHFKIVGFIAGEEVTLTPRSGPTIVTGAGMPMQVMTGTTDVKLVYRPNPNAGRSGGPAVRSGRGAVVAPRGAGGAASTQP